MEKYWVLTPRDARSNRAGGTSRYSSMVESLPFKQRDGFWVRIPLAAPEEKTMFSILGYVAYYAPDNPNANKAGIIYQHRELMSLFLGRPLLTEEHVHHIDGDRANNSLDNLEILSRAEHARISAKCTKRVIFCPVCGKETTNKKYCSDACFKFSLRVVKRPDRDTLKQDLSEMSWCAVGRKYGVTDNTVRKWAKGCNLL